MVFSELPQIGLFRKHLIITNRVSGIAAIFR
jgi:hypothetical protein